MKITITLLTLLFLSFNAQAVAPQFWEENIQASFADGDPQSVSITSDGELILAPQLKKIYDGSDAVIWKIVSDSAGNLYAATGNEGKIIKIDQAGKATTVLDTNELEVQTLIIDQQDNLFAATSPDGKIYKIQRGGLAKVFFDPEDRYIWSLALDDSGNLYAGTGDQGKIYKIGQGGNGKLLVDTDEINITVLAWEKKRNLLAGSDRNGILYSIDPSGKAFVLFDTDLQQVTAIYSDHEGDIYFAAITGIAPAPDTKPPADVTIVPNAAQSQEPSHDIGEGAIGEVSTTVDVVTPVQPLPAATAPRRTGAAQLFRLTSEGVAELYYTASEDQILDIAGYREDRILLSTAKKAKLILLDKNKKSTILLKASEEQITGLLPLQKMWISTANPGTIYQLVEDHSGKGIYYSDIKDSQAVSTWGQISWKATLPPGTGISISTRSGNTRIPDSTWSAWSASNGNADGSPIPNPRARFLQWKADFTTADSKITPILKGVRVAYLQQNIRPEVLSISLHPQGVVYRRASVFPQDSFAGLGDVPSPDSDQGDQQQAEAGIDQPYLGKKEYRKGFQTITWSATDQNQDELRFDIYYKTTGEKTWKELSKNLKEKVFAWDTQTIPDGTYSVQVVAGDGNSNPKEYALSNFKESDPFDVDNSDPTIEVIKSYREAGTIILEVRTTDRFSAIRELQYSVNPGVWNLVFPVDSISDSPVETYRIELRDLPNGSADIILKCSDRVSNTSILRHPLPR